MNSDPRSLKLLLSKFLDLAPKRIISAYTRAGEDKNISSNSLSATSVPLKTLSTSSFSQLFVQKSLTRKGFICGTPEACSEFGGAIKDQNYEKLGYVTKVAFMCTSLTLHLWLLGFCVQTQSSNQQVNHMYF